MRLMQERAEKTNLEGASAGKKHDREDKTRSRNQQKKTRTSEKVVHNSRAKQGSSPEKTGKSGEKEVRTVKETSDKLCIFDLKYQLMKKQPKCKLGKECEWSHFSKSLNVSDDNYHWTEETVSEQVRKARHFIIDDVDKSTLLDAVKELFA